MIHFGVEALGPKTNNNSKVVIVAVHHHGLVDPMGAPCPPASAFVCVTDSIRLASALWRMEEPSTGRVSLRKKLHGSHFSTPLEVLQAHSQLIDRLKDNETQSAKPTLSHLLNAHALAKGFGRLQML
jgi:hypothetical protein